MLVEFHSQWRGFQSGKRYELEEPLAELLVRRGFARELIPQKKKAKKAQTNDSIQRRGKRATNTRTSNRKRSS